jgi:hypothetical protein
MAKRPDFTADPPLSKEQLESLRQQLSRMSLTALYDLYFAAWTRCKMERDGKQPSCWAAEPVAKTWPIFSVTVRTSCGSITESGRLRGSRASIN